ncbi:hypothetical protein H6P81_012394 [Aristolochia fimbriata]|uniref:Reverse transcriptase Ty1/copia-type domain-containing protein n=1 Tax=Aristolochia fimbriata TaxID=158543 RepID=A0AAV7EES5_ARIFI|nr:hypothetical protein H6P81_012394 [Aristolochia fimbriata]
MNCGKEESLRSTEGIFIGYSRNSHVYTVFFRNNNTVIEAVNVEIADQNENLPVLDDEQGNVPQVDTEKTSTDSVIQFSDPIESHTLGEELVEISEETEDEQVRTTDITPAREKAPSMRIQKNHPLDAIIGNAKEGMRTRGNKQNYSKMVRFVCYTSVVEPRRVEEALKDEFWIRAMQEELEQFDRNEVWTLVPRSANINVIGTKWVFKNKTDEEGNVVRNKARLVAQGYTQVEGVDPHRPNYVYNLTKALYGLKQAPRAWHDRLTKFLSSKGFTRGVDKTLFIRREGTELTIAQIYVDVIIFGSTIESAQKQFVRHMKFGLEDAKDMRTPMSTTDRIGKDNGGTPTDPTLYRSMIGSLLYLTTNRPDISYNVGMCARFQSCPKESHVKSVKRIIRYVKSTVNLGIWYSTNTSNVLAGYSDADWAEDIDDRKSTSRGCFYLGTNLISCYSKKQNSIFLSTTEVEYIAVGSCCAQLIWMKQMLLDYGVTSGVLTIYCDNTTAINISKNPVQHSRTKHIDIRHHFIRELVKEGKVMLEHVSTENQLADIFTKSLDAKRFEFLRGALGLCLVSKKSIVRESVNPQGHVNVMLPSPEEIDMVVDQEKEDDDDGPLIISRWRKLIVSEEDVMDRKSRLRDTTRWNRQRGMRPGDSPIHLDNEETAGDEVMESGC